MNTQQFSTLYKCAVLKGDPFWQQAFDPATDAGCRWVINYCESEFEARGTEAAIQIIASAAINDLILLKQASTDKTIFDFLQFVLSTFVANFVVNNKMTGYAFNWIANSLADEVSEEPSRELEAGRIYDFLVSRHAFIQSELVPMLSIWCHAVYYYSRITGGHIPIAKGFLDDYGNAYIHKAFAAPTEQIIKSTCDILAWCISNSETAWQRTILNLLSALYELPGCPATCKKILAMQFSCITDSIGGRNQQQWAEEVLNTYGVQLRPFEKVQMLMNAIYQNPITITEKMDEFLESIEAYYGSLNVPAMQGGELGYELSRAFEVITPVLITLLKGDLGPAAYDILSRFFHIPNPLNNPERLLHILPNDKDGPIYHLYPKTISEKQDTSERYIQLVDALNKFLQSSIFLTGLPEYTPNPPTGERIGVPIEKNAPQYLKLLSEHFKLNELNKQISLNEASSYYLYSSINFPIQPLMVQQLGFALPMAQSAQQPERGREIKNVLIWQDDSLTSQPECTAVLSILKAGGISTTLLSAYNSTIEEFQDHYESDDYDLIYVSAHGQHEHYEPHNSYIQLSRSIQLGTDIIRDFKSGWQDRRLAFLNVCDGATTALFNSPVALGMSPLLVHSKQSVISHLWPATPMVAMLWGIVISTCIVRKLSYEEIYQEAVARMLAGKASLIAYLEPYINEETMERVSNIEIDITNFTHWGSLAHMQ